MTWPGFTAMGEYALYVWGSFGLMAMVIGGEVVLLIRRRRAQRHHRNATPSSGSRQVQI
jgi:heme exporter protein CcmD